MNKPKKELQILHSIPMHDNKFNEMQKLLFKDYCNHYVGCLSEEKDISCFDLIVLQFLRTEDADFLLNHEITTPVIWFCWGGDLFSLGRFHNMFLLPKTKKLSKDLSYKRSLTGKLKMMMKSVAPLLADRRKDSIKIIKAFSCIDYMIPVVPGDYNFLVKNYNVGKMKSAHINLINPLVNKDDFPEITGRNILLGNSASFTNNHLEAIDWLKNRDLSGRKVIIPLSYGKSDLADHVSLYATECLGKENVKVLRNFMAYDEYNILINSCEIVVMNHLRQQAMGNIVQALLNGSHIYLREESTIYQFLIENKFIISSLNKANNLVGLDKDDVLFNRQKAKKIFGAEYQRWKLDTLIENIVS
ncbi:MAG TPA: TDP-N-acetylfucosamine:lipid II N-acetylfucosaminyltransferase [Edaphocola sp.]|nr:TDP-N-acetylfucosamine:lipid II N-acetylfucosaminyltransferase [Edaphocola sp.]